MFVKGDTVLCHEFKPDTHTSRCTSVDTIEYTSRCRWRHQPDELRRRGLPSVSNKPWLEQDQWPPESVNLMITF